MQKTILSIDCGTQSTRAIIFSVKGEVLDKEQVFYEPYFSLQPGWAEQNAETYWQSLCKASLAIKSRNRRLFENIAGVGVTTLRDSMVNVDKQGNALRPLMTWLDQRKANSFYKPRFPLNLALKAVGMDQTLQKMQREGKCNWIWQNQPEIWEHTYKFMQVSGFLNYKLTGEFADSIASQIGHIPFDYKKLKWGNPKKLMAFSSKIYPVEKEKLPELVEPGKEIGKISKIASEQTGLKMGIPVIACGSDKGCETLGTGVIDSSMASLSFGTTATVQTTVNKYMEPIPFMPSYPAVIPGKFNPEYEIFRGYWMITWFKNEFAYKEIEEAAKKGVSPEEVLNGLLTQSPPGSMGLVTQPYWSPGLSEPLAKGAMIGFGAVHKKAHVYRAVLEGLSFGLLEGLQKIEKRGKLKFEKLAVSGGASQSDEICRISADVFNLPIVRGKTHESSGLGAAIITAFGTGIYNSIDEAVQKMVEYKFTFEPNRKSTELYKKLYVGVYKKMYKALEPLYKEIQEITGYPEN
ncbi:MAG: FGGY-family carbohydrate kinase [Bacteroidales bacterium]|nr:FGGY-family carbohydrate kinase [Bacteroidales bacterium]MBN2772629.1 FGGY-family carbohydrate kinase [Prolixibacteraceae bacterium]